MAGGGLKQNRSLFYPCQGYVSIEDQPLRPGEDAPGPAVYENRLDEIYPTLVNPFFDAMERGPAAGYHCVQWVRPKIQQKILFESVS